MEIKGVLPVLSMPYRDDDSVDYETFRREMDFVFQNGVHGVTLAMVTETLRLTDAERDAVVAAAVRFAAGRGPVIASVGDESVAQARRHARAAEAAGADALMAIPPSLTRCDAAGIVEYYEGILAATKLPVIIQDASGYVGNSIPVAVQAGLFNRHPDRILFKPEAQPIGPNLTALHKATGGRARVFEGTGGIALVDNYRRGVAGTMPGADLPWALVALWRALEAGDDARARRIHGPLAAMVSMQHNLDAFLAVEKLLLVHQGVFKNARVRGPVGFRMDDEMKAEVLRLFDLLKAAVAA